MEVIKKIIPKGLYLYLYGKLSRMLNLKEVRSGDERYIKTKILGNDVFFYGKCYFESGVKVYDNVKFVNARVGKYTYFADGSVISNCTIGRYCSIGPGVAIGLYLHPASVMVSTHPSFFSTLGQSSVTYADKNYFKQSVPIEIGNDVWIGRNALIKDGVKIGDGAIIGAGAVVTKDVDPYCIVGGVPAKPIRFRFTPEEIDYLLKVKWWNKDESWIKNNWRKFLDINELKKIENTAND